jgi:hypothetical protein
MPEIFQEPSGSLTPSWLLNFLILSFPARHQVNKTLFWNLFQSEFI